MTRRTGNEGLHTRIVQDRRDAEIRRQVDAEMREARLAALRVRVGEMKANYRWTRAGWVDDSDDWYAAEVERMRERAPA